MKTKLTGADLMFIHEMMHHQLKVVNHSEEYHSYCRVTMDKIADVFSKLKIEIKDVSGRVNE